MKRNFFIISVSIISLLIVYNFITSFSSVNVLSILENTPKYTIVIDAGHGGEDGGTSTASGTLEKDVNLDVALALEQLLLSKNYNVIMTRNSDSDLADSSLGSVAERKRSDMQARVELINNSQADLAISIHQNSFEESKYRGAQTFYYGENNADYAKNIQSSLIEILDPNNTRIEKEIADKYILENSNIPIVIIECGFLSNPDEAAQLTDDKYIAKIAEAILGGIELTLDTEN